jgi:hypothetical protein
MIVERYFNKHTFADNAQGIIDELTERLHFHIDRPLFRGTIYDASRLGSIIYKGKWKGKDAALKIQGLQLPRDEYELIDGFVEQNGSARIRTPHIFKHEPWDENKGYGFLLMEYVADPPVLTLPNPSQKEIETFLHFFTELKTRAVTRPWVGQTEHEKSSIRLMRHRVTQWVAIAKERGHFNAESLVPRIQLFNNRLEQTQPEIPMEFMHAHMAGREVHQHHESGQFIMFANLYWGWRPKYYDCAFIVWAIIKNPASPLMNEHEVLECITRWKQIFQNLSWIKNDPTFSKHFDLMMLERLIGTLIIDLEAQEYKNQADKQALYSRLVPVFDTLASQG